MSPAAPTCTSSDIEEVASQTCSLQGFLRGSLLLLKDTDKLVGGGVAVPNGTFELFVPPIHPVVRSDRLAEDIPHVDRGITVEPRLLEVATVRYDDYTPAKIN